MLSKLARHRLGVLIRFMDRQPPEARKKLKMFMWFNHEGPAHHDFVGEYILPGDLNQCGTTACALGFAAGVPSFHRDGLKVLRVRGSGFDGSNNKNVHAAREFFDVTYEQACVLFGYGEDKVTRKCKTPKQWARTARQLVDDFHAAP